MIRRLSDDARSEESGSRVGVPDGWIGRVAADVAGRQARRIPHPATVGMRLDEVDTPALIVDLDPFERNLDTLMDAVRPYGVRVRTHAKTHKSPDIARLQIAHGAIGVCCQKVGEAEVLVEGGISDVLVTNEIVGLPKARRLAALALRATIGVCVDDSLQVEQIGEACTSVGSKVNVYVELDVGQGRCGAGSPAEVVALARQVAGHPSLRFAGLQAYHGRAQHLREPIERQRAVAHAQMIVSAAVDALRKAGIETPMVTGAGTGTCRIESAAAICNEIQPGSYIFMDADYSRNKRDPGDPVFEQSLYVLATVISTSGGRLILDAGLKAFAVDCGLPLAPDAPGWQFARASDEHGVLVPASSAPSLPVAVGQKMRLIAGHCDPTVNLHDWFVCVRGGVVETLWPIAARGAIF